MSIQVPPQLVEKAVLRFEQESLRGSRPTAPETGRIVTISRQLGSGGRRVALALSERLQWPLWDREILDVIANQSHFHYQARLLEALDERAQSSIDALADSLVGGVDKHVYMHLLPRAILIIAQKDGIILGRGAHLLLPNAFKLRIVASMETRVRNLVQYEGLTPSEARKKAVTSDRERMRFLRDLEGRLRHRVQERGEGVGYDLTINTDRIPVPEAASMVMGAVARKMDLRQAV